MSAPRGPLTRSYRLFLLALALIDLAVWVAFAIVVRTAWRAWA